MTPAQPAVEEFRFEGAPTYSHAEVAALRSLRRLFADTESGKAVRDGVVHFLARSQRSKSAAHPDEETLQVHRVGLVRPPPKGREPGIAVRLYFALAGEESILEIDIVSARRLISRIIGVDEDALEGSDLLSSIEEGILAFFCTHLVSAVATHCEADHRLGSLHVYGIGCETGEPDWGIRGPSGWFEIRGQAHPVGVSVAFRLLLPWHAIETSWRRKEVSSAAQREPETRQRLAGRWSWVRLSFSVPLGEHPISAEDVASLREGDVIVPGESISCVDGSGLYPPFCLRSNDAGGKCLQIDVTDVLDTSEPFSLRVRVGAIKTMTLPVGGKRRSVLGDANQDQGAAQAKQDPDGTPPGDALDDPGDGVSVLADLPSVLLKIELCGITMTLRELDELRSGSIVELGRDPAAPVQLVIDDRVVGTGELVLIDGELGVRILKIG